MIMCKKHGAQATVNGLCPKCPQKKYKGIEEQFNEINKNLLRKENAYNFKVIGIKSIKTK